MAKERLQKLIAQAGVMSRRAAEAAIAAGRVSVNGVVSTEMGQSADLALDSVAVDGVPVVVKAASARRTFVFYKPREVMTTKSDDRGRRTIMEFFPEDPSLNPVGRLDYDSEGLLLMTHDGELLLRLTHPRFEVEKVYEVEVMEGSAPTGGFVTADGPRFVKKSVGGDFAERLIAGVELEDGVGKFVSLEAISSTSKNADVRAYRVVVREGRNRFIRRMFEAVGFEVSRLKRVKMGEYSLGDLKPGEKREV